MLKIRPYKLASNSARLLAQALGVKRLREHSRYVPPRRAFILNWGSSRGLTHPNVINSPQAVAKASNKLSAFRILKDHNLSTVDFTTDRHVAAEWQEDGFRVVARTLLNSHSGKGIIIVQPDEELPYAPLYTKYTKKDKEYRVHVWQGRIIDVCEKRKRSGAEVLNSLVRTLNNGWVYCRTGVFLSEIGRQLSVNAVQSLGLDFGAVDIISKGDKYWILEINSAPGLTGSTLRAYVEVLRQYV